MRSGHISDESDCKDGRGTEKDVGKVRDRQSYECVQARSEESSNSDQDLEASLR